MKVIKTISILLLLILFNMMLINNLHYLRLDDRLVIAFFITIIISIILCDPYSTREKLLDYHFIPKRFISTLILINLLIYSLGFLFIRQSQSRPWPLNLFVTFIILISFLVTTESVLIFIFGKTMLMRCNTELELCFSRCFKVSLFGKLHTLIFLLYALFFTPTFVLGLSLVTSIPKPIRIGMIILCIFGLFMNRSKKKDEAIPLTD